MRTRKRIAEQATGCQGAGNYEDYAMNKGYDYIEVLDWSSSAGDWSFIISKNGKDWRILFQTNNYPAFGFSYEISDEVFHGSVEEVLTGLSRE